ncbi:Alpha-N-acetylgalactosaminide alpha-2,6-sialyltransferase 5, partial [Larimichthys crocea]
LFLVYNGSFNSASRDANDTSIRQHEQLRRPTEAPVRVAKPHPPVLQGYSGIIDHKPLRMHCQTCALVTSSGHLIGGARGEEIDQAECVIRMNDAPTARGYARDVGRRTSLRVIAHSSMQRDTVFIFWGPSSYMRRDGKGLVYNNLRLMNQVLPKLKVYIISWQKMLQFDELFKKETGQRQDLTSVRFKQGNFCSVERGKRERGEGA